MNFEILNYAPIGILTFSREWKIEFVSESFKKIGFLYNYDFNDLTGNNILKTHLLPDASLVDELLEIEDGTPFEKEIRNIKTAAGGVVSLYVKASPVFDEERFNGGILVLEDISILPGVVEEEKFKANAFEKLFSRLNDILLITSPAGDVNFSYGKNLKKLNIESGSSGFNVNKIINPLQAGSFNQALNEVTTRRTSKEVFLEISFAGTPAYYECRIEPYINRKGQVQFVFLLFKDVTKSVLEKKNYETRLNELQQYRLIAENLSEAVFAVDLKGNVVFWNDSSEEIFGYTRENILGKFAGEVLGLFDENYFEKIKDELAKTLTWKININIFKKDGRKEILEAKFTLPAADIGEIVVLCSNITEKAESEKKLRQSEEKFRNIVTQASELICNISTDGTINFVNQFFLKSLKYMEGEIIGKNFIELIDPDYLKSNLFDISSFDKGRSKNIEIPLLTKRGYLLFVIANFSAVYGDTNLIDSYNGYFIDITEKKASEKDLMIFQSLFESSQDGIAVECDRKIIIANESFADIFNYPHDSLVGKEVLDLVSNTDTLRVAEYLKIVEQKKHVPGRLECLGRRMDGSNFHLEISVASFESEKKVYIVLITRDITERKRSQQAIRESEERYRNITENIDDFLYTYERIGMGFRPTFYTSSVEKVTGYTQTDFLSDSKLALKIVHPDDFTIVKKKLKTLMRSRIQLSEEFEFRIINKHGNIVWVRNKINLSRSSEGKPLRIYGLVSDITLRKKAEEELSKSTDNLVKLNETKDKFISIISHDLRTPFTSILGFTDLLLSDEGLSEEEKKQYVKFIRESSNSMLALVNSLLDWTRLQTGRIRFEPEKTDIRGIVENSINSMSGAAFQKNIQIDCELEDELPVFVDKNLITQVFNNLISNAIKFTKQGGNIIINAVPSARIRFYEFSVKDNGVGIKSENLGNLFRVETKFTSEGTAGEKGSGLGLSLVREIIEKHGGEIWVESEYGIGTEFKFLLPVASANILIVDDSKTDRLLYSKILKSITPDYNIDVASNGKEALDKILALPPALVITDHLMPEMNGYDLVNALRRTDIKNKPPVIVLSSELDRITITDYNELGIEYVFSKPVNLSNFKQAVEKTLKKGLIR
ncbi:MAG: PAS domain S-box protein [Ignavibacteriaceae bacterium]